MITLLVYHTIPKTVTLPMENVLLSLFGFSSN
jgi:hypothetical protein